jgi:cytoskeletal protein RodZ
MTIGNRLTKARQKKKLTLQDAYAQTRIQVDMLSALENDDFQRIPNPVYVKSFLKEYAGYLGLDVEEILNEYSLLHSQKEPAENRNIDKKETAPAARSFNPKIIKFFKVVLTGALLILLLVWSFKLSAQVKQKVLTWYNSRAKSVDQAQSHALKKQKPETVSRAAADKAEISHDGVSIPEDEKLQLSIQASEDVWIELKRDGAIIFKTVLKKDRPRQWQADESFELWTGNAAVMELVLNGRKLGSLGTGVKRGITISRDGIKKD